MTIKAILRKSLVEQKKQFALGYKIMPKTDSLVLEVRSGGNNTRTLSDKMVSLIEEKVKDSQTTITSYVELKEILQEETGETIAYGALYAHCRRKYKSKLKVARKSHHKNDPNAEAFFKKPVRKI